MKLSLSIELYRRTHTTHRSLEYLLCTLSYGSILQFNQDTNQTKIAVLWNLHCTWGDK